MVFDTILIGSGPCAVAALVGLPRGQRILVVTGADAKLLGAQARSMHPKIASTARESREDVGVGLRIPFATPARGELLRPAIVGGLANYWGQQFARYEFNDPWPTRTFVSHAQYIKACVSIEALFDCSPGVCIRSTQAIGSGYQHRTPNLVLGSAEGGRLGLHSMRSAFQAEVAAHDAFVVHLTAVNWEADGDVIRVSMADGSQAECRRLLLAAGVVGTLNLIFSSCPEIVSATFGDHAPSMLYTTLRGKSLPTSRCDGEKHFNTLAIERIINDRVTVFASLYRLSHAPLSLLLAMLKLPMLTRNINIPGLMNLITPIQVWTQATQMRYRLDRNLDVASVDVPVNNSSDVEFAGFLEWLRPRARVWRIAPPIPGGGFHFCDARVEVPGRSHVPLDEYLAETQKGRVVAVDASVLTELGCRPSALTMMANSMRIAESLSQK